MNLFVGNLDKETTEDELAELFSEYGEVKSAKIIRDIYSGDPRGFGFVEFSSKADAINAINEMNGKEFKGQELKVNEAFDKRANDRKGGRRGGKGGSRKGGGGRRYWVLLYLANWFTQFFITIIKSPSIIGTIIDNDVMIASFLNKAVYPLLIFV